jgi:hypothetical protein
MRIASPQRRWFFVIAAAVAMTFQVSAARAQHASDNPFTVAEHRCDVWANLPSTLVVAPEARVGAPCRAPAHVRVTLGDTRERSPAV